MLFDHLEFDNHETVSFARDKASGLTAIIAVHSTRLGPALGGCRLRAYASTDAALTDVLRLSRGMSYKNALAGLPLGGGKSVIIAEPRAKTPALLRAFGEAVDRLGGRYITAEDSNTTPADMQIIATATRHVRNMGFGAGDSPSPVTARGTFLGIQAVLAHIGQGLDGAVISIEGLGAVGMDLARQLHEAGAQLVVADVDAARTDEAARRYGARMVPVGASHRVKADCFAPCALGAGLNARTIPELAARTVAGAANNQLETPEDGQRLRARGVVYAPDYVVNAGGVMSIPLPGETLTLAERMARTEVIPATIRKVLDLAEREGIASNLAADRLAEAVLAAGPQPRAAA
ncbi:Glu/Leu/Phe/Val dehydrogenase dimerization domain-containing protein [Paracoccus sp. (in: a-proteobacteria)]|uniref:Glu/Leu/Phe/Val family dehydrogenase n=1 Tax=Paracoccus sp. TaxID=267 RepID=UPI00321F7B7F